MECQEARTGHCAVILRPSTWSARLTGGLLDWMRAKHVM